MDPELCGSQKGGGASARGRRPPGKNGQIHTEPSRVRFLFRANSYRGIRTVRSSSNFSNLAFVGKSTLSRLMR